MKFHSHSHFCKIRFSVVWTSPSSFKMQTFTHLAFRVFLEWTTLAMVWIQVRLNMWDIYLNIDNGNESLTGMSILCCWLFMRKSNVPWDMQLDLCSLILHLRFFDANEVFFIEIITSTQYQPNISPEEERKSGKNQSHFHIKLTRINEKWFLWCYVL